MLERVGLLGRPSLEPYARCAPWEEDQTGPRGKALCSGFQLLEQEGGEVETGREADRGAECLAMARCLTWWITCTFLLKTRKKTQNFTEYMDVDRKYSQGTGNLFSLQNIVTCL